MVPLWSLRNPLGSLCVPLGAFLCIWCASASPRKPSGTLREPSGGLPLKLLAYWEEAEHAAGVDEQDVLCANECAALF